MTNLEPNLRQLNEKELQQAIDTLVRHTGISLYAAITALELAEKAFNSARYYNSAPEGFGQFINQFYKYPTFKQFIEDYE